MIINGSSKSLLQNSGTMPNVSGALLNWFQPITLGVLTKTVVDFKLVETVTSITFLGVWEQQSPESLEVKEIGERSWDQIGLWTQPGVALKTDDIVTRLGKQYRIMRKYDWSDSGYLQFELVENYTGELSP